MKNFERIMRILAVCWMAAIFMFSAQPADESQKLSDGVSYRLVSVIDNVAHKNWNDEKKEELAQIIDYPVRKAAHMSEYALLTLLTFGAVCTKKGKRRYIIPICITFLYACTDEFHQLFIAGRSAEIKDVLIDSFGSLTSILLCNFIYLKSKIKKVNKS